MAEHFPFGAKVVIAANQRFAPRIGIRNLRPVVETFVSRRVRRRVKVQRRDARTVQAAGRNSTKYATVLEAARCVGGVAWLAGQRITNEVERIAVLVDALRKIPRALERCRECGVTAVLGLELLLKFLAPEEEQFFPVSVEVAGNENGAPNCIARIVEPEELPRQPIAVIFPVVGVQPLVAVI